MPIHLDKSMVESKLNRHKSLIFKTFDNLEQVEEYALERIDHTEKSIIFGLLQVHKNTLIDLIKDDLKI